MPGTGKKSDLMKTKVLFVLMLSALIITPGFSQEKTKKELKEERKIEKQKQTEAIVNSKEFLFTARTAMPQGGRSIDLTTNPGSVKFHPDMIKSDMPYFGTVTGAAAYGGRDGGMKFEGKPEDYTVTAQKKGYQVNAVVKGENDTYRLSLSVSSEGSSSLSITSNNRSVITYSGEISPPEKPSEK
jgi:hypothetical protein